MKVKIFAKSLRPKMNFWMQPMESMDCGLEDEINQWLKKNKAISVTRVEQNQTESLLRAPTLTVSIWYQS